MLNLMRYMNILRLSNEVLNTYGKYPNPDEAGFQQARAIYVLAFGELLRQGMPHEEKGEVLTIKTDGEEYAVRRGYSDMLMPYIKPDTIRKNRGADVFPMREKTGAKPADDGLIYDDSDLDETFIRDIGENDDSPDVNEDEVSAEKGIAGEEETEDIEDITDSSLEAGTIEEEGSVEEEPPAEEEHDESPVSVYSAVDDEVTIRKEEEGYDEPDSSSSEEEPGYEPEGFEEPDMGDEPEDEIEEPPLEDMDEKTDEEPEIREPDRDDVPPEPKHEATAEERQPAQDKWDSQVPSTEGSQSGRRLHLTPDMMTDFLPKEDFTHSRILATITQPNGAINRAMFYSYPLSLDEDEPEYILLCAIEGSKTPQITRKARGRITVGVSGYPVSYRTWIDGTGYHAECRMDKVYESRGVTIETQSEEGGEGGHIVLHEEDGILKVHLAPVSPKKTESGEATNILYYIQAGDAFEIIGTGTRKKPITFTYNGESRRILCVWKDHVLYATGTLDSANGK